MVSRFIPPSASVSEVIVVYPVTSQYPRFAACLAFAAVVASSATAGSVAPGIKDVLTVPVAHSPVIAPDGSAVAYTLRTSDWSDNRFDTEIHIVDNNASSRALTDAQGDSSSRPRWSPDSRWLAYITGGSQIHLVPADGGESIQLTAFMGGVMDYAWSPDGKTMGIIIPDPPAHMMRAARWGKFTNEEVDTIRPRLWLLDVEAARASEGGIRRGSPALRPLTGGHDFVVRSFLGANFAFSPDGGEIVFTHVPGPRHGLDVQRGHFDRGPCDRRDSSACRRPWFSGRRGLFLRRRMGDLLRSGHRSQTGWPESIYVES